MTILENNIFIIRFFDCTVDVSTFICTFVVSSSNEVHVILSKTFKKMQNYKFSYFYYVDFINNSTIKSE